MCIIIFLYFLGCRNSWEKILFQTVSTTKVRIRVYSGRLKWGKNGWERLPPLDRSSFAFAAELLMVSFDVSIGFHQEGRSLDWSHKERRLYDLSTSLTTVNEGLKMCTPEILIRICLVRSTTFFSLTHCASSTMEWGQHSSVGKWAWGSLERVQEKYL